MDLVSIIIPTYNSSSTLERCLLSVQNQSYINFEAIIIDDGSIDNTFYIVDSVVGKDSRFHYLKTKNNGVSCARNIGLDLASGKYICFVDSDDYVEPNYLNTLVETIRESNVDMVMCGWYANNESIKLPYNTLILDTYKALYFLFRDDIKQSFALWNKIFLRDSIGPTRFNPNLFYLEDGVFICEYLKPHMRISLIEEPLYHYSISPVSLSHNVALDEKRLSALESRKIIIQLVKQYSKDIERIAKVKYFENACSILYGSYINSYRKEAVMNKYLLHSYRFNYLVFSKTPLMKKLRIIYYYLVVNYDLGPWLHRLKKTSKQLIKR